MKIKITMEHSKYSIEYVPGREWDYHIMCGDEDVTNMVKNNVLTDVIFELMHYKEDRANNDENKSTDSHPIISPEDVKSKYCRFAEFDQDGCWCNLLHRMVNCCGNEETCMKGYVS